MVSNNIQDMAKWIFIVVFFLSYMELASAIQCYQCDSNEDHSCPANKGFDEDINALVDCNSFEATVPGTFCMKVTQESPGWRGWRKVTRRCGSRSDTGVAWGCRWTFEDNGVWKETCYCEDRDGCNNGNFQKPSMLLISFILFSIMFFIRYI